MPPSPRTAASTVAEAAHAAGLSPRTLRRYAARGLLDAAEVDLEQLARIRRLTGLGVNLAGVEVILHMRAQIVELREALARERQLRPWPRGAATEGEYCVCAGEASPPVVARRQPGLPPKQSPDTGRGEAVPRLYPSSAAGATSSHWQSRGRTSP